MVPLSQEVHGLNIELTRPWALTLLVVCLPVLAVFFARSLSDFSKKQRIVSVVVRSFMVLLIVLSLAGLTWLHETNQQHVLFLIDRSLSIGRQATSAIDMTLNAALEHREDHRVGFLEFAETPGLVYETRPNPKSANTSSETSGVPEPTAGITGTDLAAAIEAAAGCMLPGYVPRIVLLSEGNQTQGDATAAAVQGKVPISVHPLPTRSEPEVLIAEVDVPAEVRKGEPFFVEVVIYSNHDDVGLLEIYRGDQKVVSEKQSVTSGENRFQFQQSIDRERLADFTARISGLREDTLVDNNVHSGLVYAAGQPLVLIVESDPSMIQELAYGLKNEGIQVDVRPPEGMPKSLSDLQNYELLILSNVPATLLTQKQMEIARTFVQELGGGFIMLGGDKSFGLGGYYKSTLEEILPVRSDFEKEQEKLSLAMVLAIDKSGSMSGNKIQMARSAARSAVELLGQRDQISVLAFDGKTFVISEMQRASNRSTIDRQIARLDASGGTAMYPSMVMANEILQATSAKLKHMILLTDGESSPGDFMGIAQTMAANRITVSTVAVGEGSHTQLLEEIARVGKGRYYFAANATQVPQIFARETVTASKSAIDEQPFLPQVIRATHALKEIDMEDIPFLLGYVKTRPKPTSEVILATESGDPLLIWWRYGLGMTAAFTSDAQSRWAAEWMVWPGFSKFWTQVVRQVMRNNGVRGITVATERQGRNVQLSADAVDEFGRFLNDAEVELTVIDPQLNKSSSVLSQTAPGRYATKFMTGPSGAYHMEMAVQKDGKAMYRQSRGLILGYSDELRIRPTNEPLLKDIARLSGGTYEPLPEDIFSDDGRRVSRPTALWPSLLTIAMILWVFDVALRRIDFSLHWPFA